jgi:hypothetical protein
MELNMNSGQVEVISPYGRIYLYTHDHAARLTNDVYTALAARQRWDDADYLAKIIFCHMVPLECWEQDRGYGIGTQLYVDVNLLISVDTVKQEVTITSAKDKTFFYRSSFKSFIEEYTKGAQL